MPTTPEAIQHPHESDAGLHNVQREIAQHQHQKIETQKAALVANDDLRGLLQEVVAIRSQAEGAVLEDLSEYTDFAGFYRAARHAFDFRTRKDGSYGERWEAEANAEAFLQAASPELMHRVYSVAELFGLTGDTELQQKEVQLAIILGGGGKSPLDRTQYAADLIEKGALAPEIIVALGSDRPIDTKRDKNGQDEYDRAGDYAAGAKTEYDLMVKAAERVFGIAVTQGEEIEWSDPAIMGGLPRRHKVAFIAQTATRPPVFIISSAIVTYPFRTTKKDGKEVEVVRERANTEDTYATLARIANLEPGSIVAAITNAHFRPFQGAAASAQLGSLGMYTEVIGYDPQRYHNEPKRTDELLQEMATLASSLNKAA
jgi:hypothetical protein